MNGIKRYLPYLAGITMAVIFGFSFMFTKNALDIMEPMQLLAYRFAAAALLLTVLKLLGIVKIDLKGKKLNSLFVLSLIQPVSYFIFETLGVNLTSSSEAGMMIALIPVVVTILGVIFLNEKPTLIQASFIIASVAGVIFIVLLQGNSGASTSYLGMLVLLGAVLSAGVYNILSRKLSIHFNPVEITFIMLWIGAIVFNSYEIIILLKNGNIGGYIAPLFSIKSWIAILYLGVMSSVVAFFANNYLLSRVPASQSSVFANLTTVISIAAGVFIRGEDFYWFQAVGGVMILIGVWGANYFGQPVSDSNVKEIDYDA